jgi:queuine tRNA-ribosyltransferase
MFEFKVTKKLLGRGRAGEFVTPHGTIRTPVFMPVGTQASVKAVPTEYLTQVGAQIILANNYHLFLRPGSEIVRDLGGLHKFMNWSGPILTDSGGFQVWSLGQAKDSLVKISEEGVTFTSHIDGSSHFLSPETAIDSQIHLGADIIMAFDQCTPDKAQESAAKDALDLTTRWLGRCTTRWHEHADIQKQALFGIIQGGLYKNLRQEAAKMVIDHNLPGIAIGGETIGYNMDGTEEVMDWLKDLLPEDKPRYTMGVGLRPSDLLRAIASGVDMFDCVAPTRLARNGALFTGQVKVKDGKWIFESESKNERISIGSGQYKLDNKPIDKHCDCPVCKNYSRAYLHHLYKAQELLYYTLASIHNLRMMIKTTEDAIALS